MRPASRSSRPASRAPACRSPRSRVRRSRARRPPRIQGAGQHVQRRLGTRAETGERAPPSTRTRLGPSARDSANTVWRDPPPTSPSAHAQNLAHAAVGALPRTSRDDPPRRPRWDRSVPGTAPPRSERRRPRRPSRPRARPRLRRRRARADRARARLPVVPRAALPRAASSGLRSNPPQPRRVPENESGERDGADPKYGHGQDLLDESA